jgi:hypothetical protein
LQFNVSIVFATSALKLLTTCNKNSFIFPDIFRSYLVESFRTAIAHSLFGVTNLQSTSSSSLRPYDWLSLTSFSGADTDFSDFAQTILFHHHLHEYTRSL